MRERKNGVIEWTMRHYQITLLVITVLVGLGILGLVDMPKQEFPEFTIRQGVVVGVYPGATSGEVEEQLAKPLERYLFTFKEVKKKKTYSMSRDGMVYVMVELNDDVNNKDEVWSKIKLGLQNFKSQLPSGVLAVIANDDFGDTSALLITLESEDKTYRELQRYMETLEDRLRRIESVSNLRRYGVQNEQISVYLDPDKLAAYGLDTRMLMTTLFTQGFTTASGSLENGGLDIPIHLSVTYPSEREVGEQILLADADGHMIRLKDVARIVREYPEPDSYITNNGKKAIILSMEMREGHNIVRYGKEVDEVLHAFERDLPESVSIRRIADQPKVVGDSVSSFVRDLFVSIVVVILVMMVLFPFRSALVAATSIPISVFISIGVMYACGIPLNTVTLAALIVVLGMIVDNSIIVIDAYLEYLDASGTNRECSGAAEEYASMVDKLDRQVGAIVDQVRKLGLDKRTIIIFSSDNGHELYYRTDKGRGRGPDCHGGVLDGTGELLDVFRGSRGRVGPNNAMANLAGLKWTSHEGGIRVPLIISWPGTLPYGKVCHSLVANYDHMASFADLAGVRMPEGKDAISYIDILSGNSARQRDYVVVDHTVITGDGWKLTQKQNKPFLFQIGKDPEERHNLAETRKDQLEKLRAIYRKEVGSPRKDR